MAVAAGLAVVACVRGGLAQASEAFGAGRPASGMTVVGPGVLDLFDPPTPAEKTAKVPRFSLDRTPVTNQRFLEFVVSRPEWRRGSVPRLLADEHYLAHWQSPTSLGERADPDAPVVRVSWFAAKAYCEARGARLPTENEWELAARADETSKLGDRVGQSRRILAWYGEPAQASLPRVGRGHPNAWGVFDLHFLVWEWVHDFNSRVLGDGRSTDQALVCGGGSLDASDRTDYASFMRAAFRASLRGSYATASLGFRCAADTKGARAAKEAKP